MNLSVPDVFKALYKSDKRYKGLEGGRGSGKSWAVVDYLLVKCVQNPNTNIVCLREIQRSIKYSSKKLIEDRIRHYGLADHFRVLETEIRMTKGRGVIIFNGMQNHTIDSIKSLEGFNIAFIEEAQTISKKSIELLVPTIRAEGSELLFSWNPMNEDDPIEKLFRENIYAEKITANYLDNPYCPTSIMREAEQMKRIDNENYQHVYLGGYQTTSDAQIFKDRFVLRHFTPDESFGYPLHGMDFGFSVDPTAAVRLYIKNNVLYIYQEAVMVGLDIDNTEEFISRKIPGISKYALPCDSARPESISYLKRHGIPKAYSVSKWPGSIEDGIEFMKTFDAIVIHPTCDNAILEFNKYSYKTDRRTEDILPDIDDKHNHLMDAIRYALGKLIKAAGKTSSFKVDIL